MPPENYDSTFTTLEDINKVAYAYRETILGEFLELAAEDSTWVSESCVTEEDKEQTVICLAEISGAVRLVKKLLKLDEIKFDMTVDEDEDERS